MKSMVAIIEPVSSGVSRLEAAVSAGISPMSTLVIPILSTFMSRALQGQPVELRHMLGGCLDLAGFGLYPIHDLRVQKVDPA